MRRKLGAVVLLIPVLAVGWILAHRGANVFAAIDFTGNAQSNARAVALRYDNAAQDVFTTVPVILNVRDQNEVTLADPAHQTIPVVETRALYYPQIADGSTYRTNFILLNPWNTATTATMEFFTDNGSVTTLTALGHVAQFFTELFPSFDEFEGTLEVISNAGPVSAVALRYDNPGGTVFATSPVVVLP